MATINNKLIHFKSKSDFNSRYRETTDGGNTYGDFLGTSIVFIQDAKQIWTHGQFYDANETTLVSLGITATAEELNYMDGVTSNVQTQLNGKAATSHNHNASNINAGTLDIARIPTGTSASTVALGNHTHDQYLTDDDLSQYALKSEIPNISNLATKTELADYLPLTGGTISGNLTVQGALMLESDLNADNDLNIDVYGGQGTLKIHAGQKLMQLDGNGLQIDEGSGLTTILNENNWQDFIQLPTVDTDAVNKAGATNQSSLKLFLVGARNQAAGEFTYSNQSVYMQAGQLYATRMNATSGFYETSDGTLKNIKSELNIADNIDKIPTVLFSWKKDESEDINQDVPVHVGTIAQDIQKIYPDLVAEDAEGHLTVDYAKLSVIAIAAIKELKKEIEILKSKIN